MSKICGIYLIKSPNGRYYVGQSKNIKRRFSEYVNLKNIGAQPKLHRSFLKYSVKSHIFYFGSTNDLKKRFLLHNSGQVRSTKPHVPWKLVWYGRFSTETEARDFELYLKTGSGKAFAYKRLVSEALKKDFFAGRKSSPKSFVIRD